MVSAASQLQAGSRQGSEIGLWPGAEVEVSGEDSSPVSTVSQRGKWQCPCQELAL